MWNSINELFEIDSYSGFKLTLQTVFVSKLTTLTTSTFY